MNVSIVVPTYNEKDNVRLLADRIQQVLAAQEPDYEILFVDDSQDETPHILEQLSRQRPSVRYLHRQHERGLASAVVAGFHQARGQHIIVMDADMQHPPELIPLMIKRLASADVVIPSRFIPGGSDGGLNPLRKLVSWTARMIGCFFIQRLRRISDCTSGYFGINRSVVENTQLNPVGWKILIEVLVKGNYRTVHEIPYVFSARDAGQSKMNWREQWNYVRHITMLVGGSPEDRRFFSFCLVGGLGVFVNLFSLKLLIHGIHMDGMAASVGASLIALAHNFLWNDRVTWKDHKPPAFWRRVLQFPQFALTCGLGVALTALIARIFLALDWSIYTGQLTGILLSTWWNFTINDRWTWSDNREGRHNQLVVTHEYAGKTP